MRILEIWTAARGKPRPAPPPSAKDSFCETRWTYPVISLPRGELRFCCHSKPRKLSEDQLKAEGAEIFLNSHYDRERRLEMLTGVRHDDCATCWRREEQGQVSARQYDPRFNELQAFQTPMPLGEWERLSALAPSNPEWLRAERPVMVEIMLSTVCDMKCIYCNHHYSTGWAKELLEFGELSPELLNQQLPKPAESLETVFWQALETKILPQVWYLNILGGEPLINLRLYEFLDRVEGTLRKLDRKGVNLNLVTNLNCSPEQLNRFIERYRDLSEFLHLDLNVSMESFGARSEYIRHGLNWERWLKNLHTILNAKLPNFKLSMQMALNALAVTSQVDLLRLVKELSDQYDQPVQLRQSLVSSPEHLSPYVLSPEFTPYFDRCLDFLKANADRMDRFGFFSWGSWREYARFYENVRNAVANGPADPRLQRKLAQFIRKNDTRRGLDFHSIFPEFSDFISSCDDLPLEPEPPLG